ncbi:MAG: transcriptional regulator [Myxococcota bacterium]|nr:transcriptional regulator [Myxococcota bacterium]
MIREADPESGVTLRDVSRLAGVAEKELPDHLAHLARSLSAAGEELAIEPPVCRGCGFAFAKRTRFTRPGQCPRCKGRRISLPRLRIASRRG